MTLEQLLFALEAVNVIYGGGLPGTPLEKQNTFQTEQNVKEKAQHQQENT